MSDNRIPGVERTPAHERQYLEHNDDLAMSADAFQGAIAFDSEFIRTRTFFPIPGLYQLATDSHSYLIDPLAIDAWGPLITRLDAAQPIVMHSCSEDLELLNHHLSVQPRALFDTQVAYGFITPNFSASYAALVVDYIGLELDKGATRSNWLKRPLSAAQVHYAHLDVAWLLPIRDRMLDQLDELGRLDWCEQEMRKVTRYASADPMLYYRSLGSAWKLSTDQLAALRGLCNWREQQARAEDVPRNKVVWDENLLALAQLERLDEATLRSVLPSGPYRQYANDLLEAYEQGRSDLANLPPIPQPLTSQENRLVKALREVARKRAEGLGLAPELLARKREVEAFVRALRDAPDSLHNYADWRAGLVGEDFQRTLRQVRAAWRPNEFAWRHDSRSCGYACGLSQRAS